MDADEPYEEPRTGTRPPDHEARPEPAGGTGAAATGHGRVDEAVARLGELDTRPTSEHADVYEDVHRRLHAALTELDAD